MRYSLIPSLLMVGISGLSIGCSDDDGYDTVIDPPECASISEEMAVNGFDWYEEHVNETPPYFPYSCASVLFENGDYLICSIPTEGFILLDGEEFAITYSCYYSLHHSDNDENIFNGFFINFVTEDGCFPNIILALNDAENHGELPLTIDLDKRLCTDSTKRVASIIVAKEDDCLMPTTPGQGELYIERFSSHGTSKGRASAKLFSMATDKKVDFEIEFEVEAQISNAHIYDFHWSDNLCE